MKTINTYIMWINYVREVGPHISTKSNQTDCKLKIFIRKYL